MSNVILVITNALKRNFLDSGTLLEPAVSAVISLIVIITPSLILATYMIIFLPGSRKHCARFSVLKLMSDLGSVKARV